MQETLLKISINGQIVFCVLGIILNSIFVTIVLKTRGLGFYRWLMFTYALFEILYAATVLIGLPVHIVWEKTWIFFSYRGPLIGTPAAFLGSAVYCLFYELWMGLIVINFLYRYVVVCRNWVIFIKARPPIQFCLYGAFILFATLSGTCTLYWCANNKITRVRGDNKKYSSDDGRQNNFGLWDHQCEGHRLYHVETDIQGKPSLSGISATATHFMVVAISATTVIFCAWNIWKELKKMQKNKIKRRHSLEKQLFVTLLLQAIIPVILCHIPSVVNLTFPFWDQVFFESITPFFAMFTTIPKTMDPIISMICIGVYRTTLLKLLGFSLDRKVSNTMFIATATSTKVKIIT